MSHNNKEQPGTLPANSPVPVINKPEPRVPIYHPFIDAVAAGIISAVVGSALISGLTYFTSQEANVLPPLYLWGTLIYTHGSLVLPLAIVIGTPFVHYFQKTPGWAWILVCAVAAVVVALPDFSSHPFARPATHEWLARNLGYTMTYALTFAGVALWLRSIGLALRN